MTKFIDEAVSELYLPNPHQYMEYYVKHFNEMSSITRNCACEVCSCYQGKPCANGLNVNHVL